MKFANRTFYGTTTLGEKGQVVIPAEARSKAKLKRGEKLLVFGFHNDMLIFAKVSNLERFASHLTERLKVINKVLKKNHKSTRKYK